MRDNQPTPLLGSVGQLYSEEAMNRLLRKLEIYLASMQEVGPVRISTLNISSLQTNTTGLRTGDVWNDAGALRISGSGGFSTFTDQDATPSVAAGRNFKASNTVDTTITAFDDGVTGQEIHIVFTNDKTTIDFSGTNLEGNGGVDWLPSANDHMTCVYDGTNWFCHITDNRVSHEGRAP